jgi:hypothetical protein
VKRPLDHAELPVRSDCRSVSPCIGAVAVPAMPTGRLPRNHVRRCRRASEPDHLLPSADACFVIVCAVRGLTRNACTAIHLSSRTLNANNPRLLTLSARACMGLYTHPKNLSLNPSLLLSPTPSYTVFCGHGHANGSRGAGATARAGDFASVSRHRN